MPWTNAQLRDFGVVLLAMGEVFEPPVSTARVVLFCRAVEDLPFAAVRSAAGSYARTGRFFPRLSSR